MSENGCTCYTIDDGHAGDCAIFGHPVSANPRTGWDALRQQIGDLERQLAEAERELAPWREHRRALQREAMESTARAEKAEAALARVRALADEWERGYNSPTASSWAAVYAEDLRAALDEEQS